MRLPEEILNKIEELSYQSNKKEIAENFRKISDKYQSEKIGKSLLNKDNEAIAYAISRMPATYAAVKTAFMSTIEILKMSKDFELDNLQTFIDIGAGTGAATLAIAETLEEENIKLKKIDCLEREKAMSKLGETLLKTSTIKALSQVNWHDFDLNTSEVANLPKADIVITSYMLNEFAENKVLEVVDKLWNMTNNILLIVDPGTPKDHERLIKIKNHLVQNGGNIVAPCLCQKGCKISKGDWCHFVCRVERTKLQKEAKGGVVPYEDEKFTFLAISKKEYNLPEDKAKMGRVIRHPIIKTNMVEVKLCLNDGIENKIYIKKEKEAYKWARKAKVGDLTFE